MVAAAASTVMDKVLGAVLVEEVKDIFKEERVENLRVALEVAVVYLEVIVELEAVEVTLEETVELMKSFPVVEVGDLLTMEHISKINVVIIAMVMEECSSHYFREMYLAAPSLTYSGNSALKC